jgi:RNA polymerase sigma-70 factor, ECF subfamily
MSSAPSNRNDAQATEDRDVIIRVRNGEIQAYALLVTRYQTPVYNLMLRMLRSEDQAVDLTQETFFRAFARLETFDARKAFFPWLYTLGLNLARDHLRRNDQEMLSTRSLDQMLLDGVEPCGSGDERNPYDQAMQRRELNQALATLPDDMREGLILRFREGLSFQEIADVLGIGLSSAKMKIHRGLHQLRAIWPKEESACTTRRT